MQNLFTRFIEDESGATAIEYGLIAALISVGIIAGARTIGTGISSRFTEVGTAVTGATTGSTGE
ncbi:Flp family type IVb pilin [Litorimonas sp. WD9-15]|uniref:Flp family type IVb pilin n=1 Tax=Litorimonas sp. WD9-15 TaxID=3418716 RepID=UPI003D0620FA